MEAHQLTEERTFVRVRRGSRRGIEPSLRRALDFAVAALLLLLLSPILLLIVLAIRLDSPGRAIYRQRRVGRGRREFTVHKFRSMRSDADSKKHKDYVEALIKQGGEDLAQANGHGNGTLYKLAVDDRITRVGRLLRRFSLDELPQLWDVLLGRMSLVGPRPVIPYEVEQYPRDWNERFEVKPGLTGLWQVSGRNERTYEEMVRLDIEYAREQDLWLDAKILARTAWVVARAKGAA